MKQLFLYSFIGLIWFFSFVAGLNGQLPYRILYQPDLSGKVSQEEIPIQCADSLDLIMQTNKLIRGLHNRGFLAAAVDGIVKQDSLFLVNLNCGNSFEWVAISPGNVPATVLSEVGINLSLLKKQIVQAAQISGNMHKVLDWYADNGHPFAGIRLDSIQFLEEGISAVFSLTPNKQFVFDTLEILTPVNISIQYLEKLLGIRQGQLFSAGKVEDIAARIIQLPFLSIKGAPEVHFSGNFARVRLQLEDKKNSRFDVMIGIQQDELKPGGIKIAGELAAEMQNKLGQGEYFGLHYKSRPQNNQELRIRMDYPYVLNMPFGLNAAFGLFQNADQFRNINLNLGASYQLKEFAKVSVFWQNTESRLISIDSTALLESQKLPGNLDVGLNGLGLNYKREKLDYRYNPRKGWQVSMEGTAGLKKVLPNIQIQSLKNDKTDFSNSYDTIRGGTQLSFMSELDFFFPLGQLMALKLGNASGFKYSENGLFRNEAFRIGGSRLLRGFDEESIYVHNYTVFTVEPRLIIGDNSFIFVFGEYALIQLATDEKRLLDTPWSLGAGLSFDTKAGMLLVSAAVGSIQGSGLDFNGTRVHIGYVNLF